VTALTAWTAESLFGWFQTVLYVSANISFGPFVVCVALAESLSIRTLFFYFLWFLIPAALFLTVGDVLLTASASAAAIASSLVYWLIAGRFAGRDKALRKVSLSES
jgi:hypothetical protein